MLLCGSTPLFASLIYLPDLATWGTVLVIALAACLGVFIKVINILTRTESDKQEQLVRIAYGVLREAEEEEKEVTATAGCLLYAGMFLLLGLAVWAIIRHLTG
jgi:hypothetical protein